MNELVVTGKFLGAMPTETVGQNNYLIRKFYLDLTTNSEWPNTPEFKLKGDKVTLVDNLRKGQELKVKFNIDGRKFRSKQDNREGVITELIAWKIDVVTTASAAATPAPPRQAPPVPAVQAPSRPAPASQPVASGFEHMDDESNDLPF
ncbi:hypothetical protein GCM10028805_47230 [Spirosoma harenae]